MYSMYVHASNISPSSTHISLYVVRRVHILGLNAHEEQFPLVTHEMTIMPTVEHGEKLVYISTLVLELNGNPILLKDNLILCQVVNLYNNTKDYMIATSCNSTHLLGLGLECGVYFVVITNHRQSSTANCY